MQTVVKLKLYFQLRRNISWWFLAHQGFAGWWFQSLWEIWKSVGMIIPNIWKVIKTMFQTTKQYGNCYRENWLINQKIQGYPWGIIDVGKWLGACPETGHDEARFWLNHTVIRNTESTLNKNCPKVLDNYGHHFGDSWKITYNYIELNADVGVSKNSVPKKMRCFESHVLTRIAVNRVVYRNTPVSDTPIYP